jgi:hypothetical protein
MRLQWTCDILYAVETGLVVLYIVSLSGDTLKSYNGLYLIMSRIVYPESNVTILTF